MRGNGGATFPCLWRLGRSVEACFGWCTHHAFMRRLGVLGAALVWIAVSGASEALAQGDLAATIRLPNVYLTMENLFPGGEVGDGSVINELLAELGYVHEGDTPRVVRLRSIDSQWDEVEYGWERDLWNGVLQAAAEFDAPPPLIVLSPQSSEASRRANGSFFPSTPDELSETGFDWLVHPDGFEILRDTDETIANRIAQRWLIFGVEEIGGLAMTLCVAEQGIIGWARAYALKRPGLASIGKFVDDCTKGELELYTDYSIPQGLREEYGLAGGPFALLLPWFGYEHVAGAIALAEGTLSASRVGIPMRVVATETIVDEAGSRYMARSEHAELLERVGIDVDVGLSEAMPAWVDSFAASRGGSLLLFDGEGELIGSYYVTGLVPPDRETLSQGMLRLGLLF